MWNAGVNDVLYGPGIAILTAEFVGPQKHILVQRDVLSQCRSQMSSTTGCHADATLSQRFRVAQAEIQAM